MLPRHTEFTLAIANGRHASLYDKIKETEGMLPDFHSIHIFCKIDKNIGHKAVQLNKAKLERKINEGETEFKELKKSTKFWCIQI